MYRDFIGLRVVSVLILSGIGFITASEARFAEADDYVETKPGILRLVSQQQIPFHEMSPAEIAYVEAMQDHLN